MGRTGEVGKRGGYFKHVSQYVDVSGRGRATEEKTLPPLVLLLKQEEEKPIRARSKELKQRDSFSACLVFVLPSDGVRG